MMTSNQSIALWQTTRFVLDLSQPKVMAIVNVTPDSFSDGGLHSTTSAALKQCELLIRQGADILDIGGESTRPGAVPLDLSEELNRVLPVAREAVKLGVPVSVDTYKPDVMRAVLDLGVDVINDIYALRMPKAVDVMTQYPKCGICLMHMHGQPLDMQTYPLKGDVVESVTLFLRTRIRLLEEQGIPSNRLVMDPGIGFGKTVEQNFTLLAEQLRLTAAIQRPWLAGWSRKSALGAVTGRPEPTDRTAASISAAVLSVEKGARVVRVHDVPGTVDALRVWNAQFAACRANEQ